MAAFNVPLDFVTTVNDRLVAAGSPASDRYAALAVLAVIVSGGLESQTYACRLSLGALAAKLAMSASEFVTSVKTLAAVGAIAVVKRQGERRIAVTVPGGLQRGRPRHFPTAAVTIGSRTFTA